MTYQCGGILPYTNRTAILIPRLKLRLAGTWASQLYLFRADDVDIGEGIMSDDSVWPEWGLFDC